MADRSLPKSADDYIFAKISSNILKIDIGGFLESLIPNFTSDLGNSKWPTELYRKVPKIKFSLKTEGRKGHQTVRKGATEPNFFFSFDIY